jgi:hypothetical protein
MTSGIVKIIKAYFVVSIYWRVGIIYLCASQYKEFSFHLSIGAYRKCKSTGSTSTKYSLSTVELGGIDFLAITPEAQKGIKQNLRPTHIDCKGKKPTRKQ